MPRTVAHLGRRGYRRVPTVGGPLQRGRAHPLLTALSQTCALGWQNDRQRGAIPRAGPPPAAAGRRSSRPVRSAGASCATAASRGEPAVTARPARCAALTAASSSAATTARAAGTDRSSWPTACGAWPASLSTPRPRDTVCSPAGTAHGPHLGQCRGGHVLEGEQTGPAGRRRLERRRRAARLQQQPQPLQAAAGRPGQRRGDAIGRGGQRQQLERAVMHHDASVDQHGRILRSVGDRQVELVGQSVERGAQLAELLRRGAQPVRDPAARPAAPISGAGRAACGQQGERGLAVARRRADRLRIPGFGRGVEHVGGETGDLHRCVATRSSRRRARAPRGRRSTPRTRAAATHRLAAERPRGRASPTVARAPRSPVPTACQLPIAGRSARSSRAHRASAAAGEMPERPSASCRSRTASIARTAARGTGGPAVTAWDSSRSRSRAA